MGQTSLVHAFTPLSGTSACSRASRSSMPQETTASNFTAVSHPPWAGRDQLMAASSTPQRCIAPTGAYFVTDFSTVLALYWQRPWHTVLHEALREPCPLGWSRQVLGVAVACLYLLPSTPKQFSLLGNPTTTHLSKEGTAACICTETSQACLQQDTQRPHSQVLVRFELGGSQQCSAQLCSQGGSQRASEQDLEGIILGGK